MSRPSVTILLSTLLAACAAGRGPIGTSQDSPDASAASQTVQAEPGVQSAGDQPAAVSDGRAPAPKAVEASAPALAAGTDAAAKAGAAAETPSAPSQAPAASPLAAAQTGEASRRLAAEELSLWNDPAFKRRFTESYLSDTTIEPTPTDEEIIVLAEVSELLGADRQDKALALLQKRRNKECSAVIDCYVANLELQQERLDEAIACYQVAVEKFPKFRRAWSNLSLAHIRRGDYADGARAVVRTIELGGGTATLYGLLGVCHMQTEHFVAAESAYRMANLLEPGNPDWEVGMASAFFKQQRYPEAIALFGGMLQRRPDDANLWLSQAKAYLGMQQPLKAAENFEVVKSLGAATVETLNLLGNIYINDGITELGADAFLEALAQDQGKVAGPALTAAKSLLLRYDAVEDADRVLAAVDPAVLDTAQQKERLNLLARLSIAKDPNNLESLEVLAELVALDPLDGDALIRMARSYGARGEVEQALFHFQRASGIEGFEERAKLAQGQFLVNQQRFPEALPLLRRALDLRKERNEAGLTRKEPTESLEAMIQYVERKTQTRSAG
jgi:tetratricopeptide (TPR) repeat protein